MTEPGWSYVAAYADRLSADAVAGLLNGDGLPCYVSSDAHLPGLGTHFAVRVPAMLMSRAQALLESARVTEHELSELALSQPRGPSSCEL